MKTIKKIKTSQGNNIEFYTTDLIEREHVIVRDNSCQLEKVYYINESVLKDIDNDTEFVCKSSMQVIKHWENELVWF